MLASSLLSYVAIAWLKVVPMQTIDSKKQFIKIFGLSSVFCFSVVLGNVSLQYLPAEPSFHLFGFLMCVSATAARASKSVLQAILLSSE
ncbi:hypothetical protein Godav_020357, partial [Gossypium davidsonii]|nr:hypothetical protein [Gossypium davidsonii]